MENITSNHLQSKVTPTKMMSKKALQPPSTIMILIAGIIILAILIILALFFKQNIGESGVFNYATEWSGFRWG